MVCGVGDQGGHLGGAKDRVAAERAVQLGGGSGHDRYAIGDQAAPQATPVLWTQGARMATPRA
jgi:hypothetical protein